MSPTLAPTLQLPWLGSVHVEGAQLDPGRAAGPGLASAGLRGHHGGLVQGIIRLYQAETQKRAKNDVDLEKSMNLPP